MKWKLTLIVYCLNVSHVYSQLSPVLCDIVSETASSPPVECTFSSINCQKEKKDLADYNLERDIDKKIPYLALCLMQLIYFDIFTWLHWEYNDEFEWMEEQNETIMSIEIKLEMHNNFSKVELEQ